MCKCGKPEKDIAWYEDSLPISVLPLPVPDKSRPWGGNCTKCPGVCSGLDDDDDDDDILWKY